MKNLKVTWQDGSWNRDGQQPTATAMLPLDVAVSAVGEDTLVFRKSNMSGTSALLVIPAQRLISAVEEEVSE